MRIRYCKIIQNVRMNGEEDAWLTPLENVHSLDSSHEPMHPTRLQQIQHYCRKIWKILRSDEEPSSEWMVLEEEKPTRFTSKMKTYFKRIHSSTNEDSDSMKLQKWMDTLVDWMMDSEETVSVIL